MDDHILAAENVNEPTALRAVRVAYERGQVAGDRRRVDVAVFCHNRAVLKHSILLALIVGLIVMVHAYVLPGWVPSGHKFW